MSRTSFVLLFAACGGGSTDIEGTLRFADRSDLEISRLVNAASGSEGFQAQATAESYADPSEPGDACPARSLAGNVGTITGGCTTQDGVTLEGSITIENPLNWCLVFDENWCDTQYEASWNQPTKYTFSAFTITQSGFTRSFDGRLTSASIDGYIDMDITSVQLDIAVRSDIYMERDGAQNVDINGSGIELVGVGGARVNGHVGVSSTNQTSGSFTLDGADTLQVTTEGGCIRWHIEGTERKYSTCP